MSASDLARYGARTLAKPFDLDELRDLVRDALERWGRIAS